MGYVSGLEKKLGRIESVGEEILEWVEMKSRPNDRWKYSRCPVCGRAYWTDWEQHERGCWVPRLADILNEQGA